MIQSDISLTPIIRPLIRVNAMREIDLIAIINEVLREVRN